jgi:hypothetical protein
MSGLYQFSSVYRHFVLNKYAVVRGRFDTRSVKPYYLCTVVLFDIPKDSDIVDGYELSSGDVIDQYPMEREDMKTGGEGAHEEKWSHSINGTVNSKWASTHVDSDTLPSKSTRSTDAVNVIFTIPAYGVMVQRRFKSSIAQLHKKHVRREIIVDHKRDLLHINSPSPYIRSDQHPAVERWWWRLAKGLGEDGVF